VHETPTDQPKAAIRVIRFGVQSHRGPEDSFRVETLKENALERELGLFDSTMLVAGSMIGSGIFIVPAAMARQLGSAGWLLADWLIAGLMTVTAALSYGELAAMMPRAGGQYVYLREAWSPLWGFLYGWTLFLVIQTGTIAAVAVAFARYLGFLCPSVSEDRYLFGPWRFCNHYALSLSTAQFVGIALILALTWSNLRGIRYGKLVQNIFTVAKIGALVTVIGLGFLAGWNSQAVRSNFSRFWTPHNASPVIPGLGLESGFGLFIALGVTLVGPLLSSDAWNSVTFSAGEVRNPKRTVPLALAWGTMLVVGLYLCANLAYLVVLPLAQVQHAPSDRVAAAALEAIFPSAGGAVIALLIMISTCGCINGMTLSGSRAFYAMAQDGLFFRPARTLNRAHVPGAALVFQGAWASFLVLLRTYDPLTGTYGNLYSNLLDYVISAALLFYFLTIAGLFRLRRLRPHAERTHHAWGYPVIPALYLLGSGILLFVLLAYRPATTIPGLVIVLIGLPVYLLVRRN